MSTNPARLGELTAYDLGSTITFRDGGATYTGSLLAVKHEFPDGKRRTFVMLLSSSGKWRHADRYPSNLPIVELVRPTSATAPATGGEGGRASGGVVAGSIVIHETTRLPAEDAVALRARGELIRRGEIVGLNGGRDA